MINTQRISVPSVWIQLTTSLESPVWIRLEEVSSYGAVTPEHGGGNAWLTLVGTDTRWYVLETVERLHDLLGNANVIQPIARSTHARTRHDT